MDKKLALQIRSLRGDLSQQEMEKKTGIKQQAISRLENPYYGKASLTTLKKLAGACDVALVVEFVPYSQFANRVSGTAYLERGFTPETMNIPTFEEEEQQGIFESIEIPVELISQIDWVKAVFDEINHKFNELANDKVSQPADAQLAPEKIKKNPRGLRQPVPPRGGDDNLGNFMLPPPQPQTISA